MSKTPKTSKQASRWGSLLQQAVAGVESRLDTILADGDEPPAPLAKAHSKTQDSLEAKESSHPTALTGARAKSVSRGNSNGRNNERLQERLAKAVVKSGNTWRSESPASTSEFSSREVDSPRTSFDIKTEDARTETTRQVLEVSASATVPGGENSIETGEKLDHDLYPGRSTTIPVSTSEGMVLAGPLAESRPGDSSLHHPAHALQWVAPSDIDASSATSVERRSTAQRSAQEYEALLSHMQSDYEIPNMRRQDETHSFMERIDELQSKLQYLTKEALGTANTALTTAAAGSLDRRLAEKDQKISLLMGEGENLSKTELRNTNIIKTRRSSMLEDEKHTAGVRVRLEKAEQELQNGKERPRHTDDFEQRELESSESLSRVAIQNGSLKAELDPQRVIAAGINLQLAQAPPNASPAEIAVQVEALEQEKAISARLRGDLSKTRIEMELSEEKLRSEIRRITKEAEREKGRARATEMELRREQSMLEHRLEVLNAQAEEVTTSAVSDTQTKLLRQVEVLQTQHSIAIENWQGVEGSLLHRIQSLEEEKDELTKKEGDLRRRNRDMKLTLTRANEELDTALGKINNLDRKFAEQSTELETVQERLRLSEATLAEIEANFTKDRASWEAVLTARIEDERNKWNQENNQISAGSRFRIRSPRSYTRKRSSADLLSVQTRRPNAQSNAMNVSMSIADRSIDGHDFTQALAPPDVGNLISHDSLPFTPQQSISSTVPPTPSIQASDQEDPFEGSGTPASLDRTINDMISVSTAGAGPSVQLVERMSATVRRLESEKAALKDELARLSYQRDEAREQVVSFMREAEQKRAADNRIQKLEQEICQVNERYHTTLEMLGEKSELVEELKADVADVKKIYRELVDSTMR